MRHFSVECKKAQVPEPQIKQTELLGKNLLLRHFSAEM